MSRGILQDFVQDPSGNALVGVEVEVFTADGLYTTQAELWDAATGGNPVGNPLTTGDRGYFGVFADTAEYDLRITTSGGSFDVPNVPVFDADELTDLAGSVATAVSAAAESEASAVESAASAVEAAASAVEAAASVVDALQTAATLAELVSSPVSLGGIYETTEYSTGTGGGNKYLVVAGGTGTDDGGSYIDADNGLQLKGLFPAGVYTAQFGVTGTGNEITKIQAAHDYVASTNVFKLHLGGQTIKIDSVFTQNASKVGIIGPGKINAADVASGEAWIVEGTIAPSYFQVRTIIKDVELAGDTTYVSGSTNLSVKYGATAKHGITFKGSGTASGAAAAHVAVMGLNVHHFDNGRRFQSSAYGINFYNCDVFQCQICDHVPAGFTDYGERLNFVGGFLYQARTASLNNGAVCDMYYEGVSFDAVDTVAKVANQGDTHMNNCHVETGGWDVEDHWFWAEGAGSLVQFTNGRIMTRTAMAVPFGGKELIYSAADVSFGGVQITDSRFDINTGQYGPRFLALGSGRVNIKNLYSYSSSLAKKTISRAINKTIYGDFSSAPDLTAFTQTVTSGYEAGMTIDNVIFYEGTGSAKFSVATPSNRVEASTTFRYQQGQRVALSYYIRLSGGVSSGKFFYVILDYLDNAGSKISEYSKAHTITASTVNDWALFEQLEANPPVGTETVRLRFFTGIWDTDITAWIDDLVLTIS